MKKNLSKILALVLVVCMTACLFVGCKKSDSKKSESESTTPLVVGYSPFNEKFSPFFSETAYDQDVWGMTQISLLNSDRRGTIIMNGIEGETINYNGTDYKYTGPADCKITENADGTVTYDFKLRDDLKFSDGEKVTIDDVIFSMYVLCDPTYDGNSSLFALPIQGLTEYRSGIESLQSLILKAGPDGADPNATEEETKFFWETFNTTGVAYAKSIIDYCMENYGAVDAASSAGLWGFEIPEGGTESDLWDAIIAKYGYDMTGIDGEKATDSMSAMLATALGDKAGTYQKGIQTGDSAANISGIQKIDDYNLRVVLTEVDATAIYQLGVAIAPLHYYGDKAQYDYANNKFGFPKGDLAIVKSKTTQPMGAGPYKFIKFENGVVNFESNANYYKGKPKTKYVNFQQCLTDDDKLNGVVTGTIDITDPSFSQDKVKAITEANKGKGITGDVITTSTVDNLGYGYLGISAKAVNVGGELASEASKNLRKAFATVFSVYRELTVESYYGERASVINYPISNTSWAAPQTTDDGYKVAFSVDVNGNDIYTSDMTAEQKYDAALQAALGFFEAAGYTVQNGKLTAAPNGAKLEYEVLIPADGNGDHPSFMMCSEAAKALEKIGMKLIVTDLANSSELWTSVEADQADMWCAAWGASVDPDMYQIYYSDVANGGANPGGSNYMYDIADPELDRLIVDARKSLDQAYRKTMYKACLDLIVDWAVEVPVYQRQNAIIFSTERLDMKTVTPDITTFYGWNQEIENIRTK